MIKVLLVILFVYVVPVLVGSSVNKIWKMKSNTVRNFLLGNIFIWAFLQLITVPLVMKKQSFLVVVAALTAFIVLLSVTGLVLWIRDFRIKGRRVKTGKKIKAAVKDIEGCVACALFLGLLGYILYQVIALQHTDADDSRFVVNAADMVRTNRMFLTDPSTGLEVEHWFGELYKDVTSPWAVYLAYCSKMTGVKVAIMAHSVLPVFLILCVVATYWLLAKHLVKSFANRCIFMFIVLLVQLYGCMSIYTSETFMLTRIWQGKSVVASMGIPTLFLFGMWLYKNEKDWRYYILVGSLNMAMCLMSGMGIIIGAIMLGCMAVVYGIAKKNFWMMLGMVLVCVPNGIYYLMYSQM